MQNEGEGGGGDVSIGEEDQLRDRDMIRELQDEDGQQDDKLDPARRGRTVRTPTPPKGSDEDGWHPGDAEQPDRASSEGLTGSGPAQPDP